jgi:antitoxin component HigA of HigAB toxin-antitoxin module
MDTSAPAVQAPGRFGFSINRGKTLMPTELLGGRSRLSEFLRGERSLSKGQIESLRQHLGIPADLLH